MRGSGESLGRQSGIPEFQVADIVGEDYNLFRKPDGGSPVCLDCWQVWCGVLRLFKPKAEV